MARKAKRDLTIEQKLARGPIDLPFLALVMLLTAIGLIMVLSASFASAMYDLENLTKGDPYYYFKRQAGLRCWACLPCSSSPKSTTSSSAGCPFLFWPRRWY